MPHRFERQEEQFSEGMEVSADTPIGKLAAKGVRVGEVIGLITLLGVCLITFFTWQMTQTLDKHNVAAALSESKLSVAIQSTAIAQRMQTCILSVPQERREQEYMSTNGFCRQMSQLP